MCLVPLDSYDASVCFFSVRRSLDFFFGHALVEGMGDVLYLLYPCTYQYTPEV